MKILNLTQHKATAEQVQQGVIDLTENDQAMIKQCLTFDSLPDHKALKVRAETIAQYAKAYGFSSAMIGGAPYLMSFLENALWAVGIRPLYAFSIRKSVEEHKEDGSVVKRNVFCHKGFVGMEYAEPQEELGRPCQCGSGVYWAICPNNNEFCG